MGKIVTFGEIMLRLSPNGFNRLFQNDQFQATFGGAEANVAVSLANFGEDVSFVTKLPDNPIGDGAVRCLRSFGADTSFITRGGERVGVYYLEKGADQRGSVCIYDRRGSSFAMAERSDFNWDMIFDGADWFHFTGITPALGKNVFEICREACAAAKRRGMTVSCDLNYRSKMWTKEEAGAAMTELCSYIDVCIANEEDAKCVFGLEADKTDVLAGKINKAGYKSVSEKLINKFGFSHVAFTFRTSHSATVNDWSGMLFDGRDFFLSKEYHIDCIVDRVGGGDSFGAGLIYSLRKGYDPQRVIDFAAAASALKHSIEGDFNRVGVDEVIRLADGDGSGRVRR
ncbi:MAG: sugar kinase [Clostridia bacterium]|nr:sugar kinase [Clostridia bacterium]